MPLIEQGFVSGQRELLGDHPRQGGLDVRWQTKTRETLQLVANFGDHPLPMPELVRGECLWQAGPADEQILAPGDIIVRLGQA